MANYRSRLIVPTKATSRFAQVAVSLLAVCGILGFGLPSDSQAAQDCIGLYFDSQYSTTCLQDSSALFTPHEAYIVIKDPSVSRAIAGYELSLNWDSALYVTLTNTPGASINLGQFPQMQVAMTTEQALPVAASILVATISVLPTGSGSIYISSYYRPSIMNCVHPVYVDADDPGHLVELQQCEGGLGGPAASILSPVCPEPPPSLSTGEVYAGDQGIVYYLGEELSPPWIFAYDSNDTLRLNGRAVVPQPLRTDAAVARLSSEQLAASDKRESCLKSAKDAFIATASADAYKKSLLACDGDDVVSVEIDSSNGYPRATIAFSGFVARLIVPLRMPIASLQAVDARTRQEDFLRRFLEFMRKPDRCVVIGRGWDMWSREDVEALRRAVAAFVRTPPGAEAVQDAELQGLSRNSVLRDGAFQKDLRRVK